jgi:tetratricopeptide (TPR) repeat protein
LGIARILLRPEVEGRKVNFKDYNDARHQLKMGYEDFPDNKPLVLFLASHYHTNSEYDKELPLRQRMLRLSPKDFRTWHAIAKVLILLSIYYLSIVLSDYFSKVYYELGRNEEAFTHFKAAIDLIKHPTKTGGFAAPRFYHLGSMIAEKLEKYGLAVDLIDRALAEYPKDTRYLLHRGI